MSDKREFPTITKDGFVFDGKSQYASPEELQAIRKGWNDCIEQEVKPLQKQVEELGNRAEGLQSKSNIFEGMYLTQIKKVEELKEAISGILANFGRITEANLQYLRGLLNQKDDENP